MKDFENIRMNVVPSNDSGFDNTKPVNSTIDINDNCYVHPIATSGDFINYKDVPLFFTMAFPTLFMPSKILINGNEIKDSPSDYNRLKSRAKLITFGEWAC